MERILYIKCQLADLFRDEDGAVTVDWIVLTATILFLGIISMFIVTGNIPGFADRVSSSLSNMTIGG